MEFILKLLSYHLFLYIDYYWVWKLLCVCSIIIFLMNIIVFGLWIASGGTSNEGE